MDEGYFPTVREINPHNYVVENQNTDCMGGLRWKGEWGCFVFEPMLCVQLGPAFLTNLASHMIRLEAKLRKDLDKRPSTIDYPEKEKENQPP